MTKKEIRQAIMAKRNQLSESDRLSAESRIIDQLFALKPLHYAKCVSAFVDFRNEVPMRKLLNRLLSQGKVLALPWIDMTTKTMRFYETHSLDDLIVSDYGILEPNPNTQQEVSIDSIDFVIAPGLAFTKDCYRLGYGGGFYDRFFESLSPHVPKVALAFDCQIVATLPLEPHDLPLDTIITEVGVYGHAYDTFYFEPFNQTHVNAIWHLFEQLKAESVDISFTEVDSPEVLKSWIDNPLTLTYVAKDDDGQAIAVIRGRRDNLSSKKHAVFLTAATHPLSRSQGTASALTFYSLYKMACDHDVKIARIYVYSDNLPSLATVKKLHFELSGKVIMHHFDHQSQTYVDDLIFHKKLFFN